MNKLIWLFVLALPLLWSCDSGNTTFSKMIFSSVSSVDSEEAYTAERCPEGADELEICGDPANYKMRITSVVAVACSIDSLSPCDVEAGVLAADDDKFDDQIFKSGAGTASSFLTANDQWKLEAMTTNFLAFGAVKFFARYAEATLPTERVVEAWQGATIRLCFVDGADCFEGAETGDLLYKFGDSDTFRWFDTDGAEYVSSRPTNPKQNASVADEDPALGKFGSTGLQVAISTGDEVDNFEKGKDHELTLSAEISDSINCFDSEQMGTCDPSFVAPMLYLPTSYTIDLKATN